MQENERRSGCLAMVLLACAAGFAPVLAQGSGSDAAGPATQGPTAGTSQVGPLELSEAQRQAIYTSISNRQTKKDTAPVGFQPSVGGQVPVSIELAPLPKAVAELVPKTAEYEYAFVANQVLIVDPQSRTIVALIH